MMNRKFNILLRFLIILLFVTTLTSCSRKNKSVVAEIGDEKIYSYEFEEQYVKNEPNVDSLKNKPIEQKREMLDRYIDLRLKVKDAKDKGYLDLPEIKDEISEYKKNTYTFLLDKDVVIPGIQKLYDRKKYEIRISHILVSLPLTATGEDTVKAYAKAELALRKLKDKEDFAQVAKELSDDPSAKSNGGDLYYFTGGTLVPEFEDAAFSLNEGEYTKKPVRTQFGLHIIKVTGKRKNIESISLSHIFFTEKRDSAGVASDSMEVVSKVLEVQEKLKNGENFEALASQYSMDQQTAPNGGLLGVMKRTQIPVPIDSAISSLKVGKVVGPIRSQFGWHFVKINQVNELLPYERIKESLKSEFKRSDAYKKAYSQYMDKVRKEYKFEINYGNIGIMKIHLDSNLLFSQINLDSAFMQQDKSIIMASFNGGEVKLEDILLYLKNSPMFSNRTPLYKALVDIINEGSTPILLNYVAQKRNIEKDEEYQSQFNDFLYGILKFKVEQEEVNSKINIKEEEIQNYYEQNKNKYTYTDSSGVKVRSYDEVKMQAANDLQQQRAKDLDKAYLDRLRQKYPVKVHDSILEKTFKNL